MRVNYILMYGTPYLKYRVFETFEDVSKYLVNHWIVNYSIFKKLEDKEEIEMIYRDNDIRCLEQEIERLKKANKKLSRISNKKEIENFVLKNIIKEAREYINTWMYNEYELSIPIKDEPNFCNGNVDEIVDKLKEILDKGEDK